MIVEDMFSDESIESSPEVRGLVVDTGEPHQKPKEEAEGSSGKVEADNPESVDPPMPEAPVGETAAEKQERLLAGKYKSHDELEKGYQNLESLMGRKESEYQAKLREQEALMEALLEAMQEDNNHPSQSNPVEGISDFAQERPDAAMQWAVEHNREAVPEVLASIEAVNPKLAREYELAYTELLTEERLQAHTQPLMEQMRVQQQQAEIQNAFTEFQKSMGDDYAVIQDVLPSVIEEHAHLADQIPPGQFLNLMGSIARGRSVPKIEAAVNERTQAEAAMRRNATAETGSAPTAAAPDASEEDLIVQAMFNTQSKGFDKYFS